MIQTALIQDIGKRPKLTPCDLGPLGRLDEQPCWVPIAKDFSAWLLDIVKNKGINDAQRSK